MTSTLTEQPIFEIIWNPDQLRNPQQAADRFINLYGGVTNDPCHLFTYKEYLNDLCKWAGLTPYQKRVINEKGLLWVDQHQVYLAKDSYLTQAEQNVFYKVRDAVCKN